MGYLRGWKEYEVTAARAQVSSNGVLGKVTLFAETAVETWLNTLTMPMTLDHTLNRNCSGILTILRGPRCDHERQLHYAERQKHITLSRGDGNNLGHILSRAVITVIIEPATINSDEFLVFCSSEAVSKF